MTPKYTHRTSLSYADTKAIRAHCASVPFLHLPRVAKEYDISIDALRSIAGQVIDARKQSHPLSQQAPADLPVGAARSISGQHKDSEIIMTTLYSGRVAE